ncbi:MAG: OsmC family peroxiredoxin [Trueperaceae bacterium]|nr:OsmC family peroxiredoxin [Trueperaceae bacterium]
MPVSTANARWEGTLKEGKGTMRLPSGTYEGPFSFVSRFEKGAGKETGTNPEELIAAAHAGCYAMALSGRIVAAGFTAESIDSEAQITMSRGESGVAISKSHLVVRAKVPGMSAEAFQAEAEAAKAGCPVSKALAALEITLDAALV